MKNEILSRFYRFNGTKNEFLKQFFIRFIRNRIIDPNTKIILDDGFKFFDLKTKKVIQIPCDDSNWCEFNTFNEGFKLEDFKKVIDKMTMEWKDNNKMKVYLRPETLFGTKFESYLNRPAKPLTTNDLAKIIDWSDF